MTEALALAKDFSPLGAALIMAMALLYQVIRRQLSEREPTATAGPDPRIADQQAQITELSRRLDDLKEQIREMDARDRGVAPKIAAIETRLGLLVELKEIFQLARSEAGSRRG